MSAGSTPAERVGDQDMFIFNDQEVADPSASGSTAVGNMFAAWNPPADTYTFEFDLPRSSVDSTEYQLAPSEDSQYEASDYQLASWPDELKTQMQPIPMPLASQASSATEDPFGQDFDEEFEIESTDVRRWQARQQERQAVGEMPESLSDASATNEMHDHYGIDPSVAYQFADSQSLVVQPNFTAETPFVAMTASSAVDEQVVAEIEDLISQLNFSAFSVEMDSVEQISPECIRQAAAAQMSGQQMSAQGDQAWQDRAVVIPMRQPDSQPASMDDDRDLLIIEEEVPASMRHPAPVPVAPTPHTMSYPDLFQQLRG